MSAQPLTQTRLANGITVIAVENNAADIVAARCFLRAGGRWETPGQRGISHLLSAVMTKGTTTLSSADIADQVESTGANMGTDVSADYFVLSLKTVTADFPNLLRLAADLLRSPSFPTAEVQLERQLTLQNIRAQQERPFSLAFQQLRTAMYAGHPYGGSMLGTPETIQALTPADLHAYHHTYFRPDNLVISLCGRIVRQDAIALVDAIFGDWTAPAAALPLPPIPTLTPQPGCHIIPQDTQQSIVMLGYAAPSVHNTTDYVPLKVINTYLGSGLSSRLFVELREKQGLAYDVSAFYPTRYHQSQFVAYMGTAPENTQIAVDCLHRELKRLCEVVLDPEDLQASKNKLLGQYALGKQTNAEIAQLFGWYQIIDLGVDFDQQFQDAVNAVTLEDLQTIAQRYFTTPYLSILGPATHVSTVIF